jgi:hypothetical protein
MDKRSKSTNADFYQERMYLLRFASYQSLIFMDAIVYPLFFLVLINFYLVFRKKNTFKASEKFVVSLMSIFILFFLFYFAGLLWGKRFAQMSNPTFNLVLVITMNFVMPVIITEIVLALYTRYVTNRKK